MPSLTFNIMDKFQEKLDLEINIAKLTDILRNTEDLIEGRIEIPLVKDSLFINLTNEIKHRIEPIIKAKILELEIELLKIEKSCIM